jgi:hypothetical protein
MFSKLTEDGLRNLRNVVRHREAASVNQNTAEEFVQDFSYYVKANGFIPQQVFTEKVKTFSDCKLFFTCFLLLPFKINF